MIRNCLAKNFGANSQKYNYSFNDCNSNWFANSLLESCLIFSVVPTNYVFGWNKCSRFGPFTQVVKPPYAVGSNTCPIK